MRFFVFMAIVLAAGFLVIAYGWGQIYLPYDSDNASFDIFSVQKGEGAKEISKNLKSEGFIRYSSLFRIYVLKEGFAGKLQAGDYRISPSMAIPEIARKFVEGDVEKRRITIIEGWDSKDIADYLEKEDIAAAGDFLAILEKDFSGEFDFLDDKPSALNLEGYLFPDTYEVSFSAGAEDIVRETLSNFGRKFTGELRKEALKQDRTIFEIITMASLVEKEVKTLEDKKIVSGILWKRLGVAMPLQVDATLVYITGRKTTKISIEETKIDSPYNTYKYSGLPLGPISGPGLESIKAALYPESSEYWYYLSTPEGETIFSRNLQEHSIAKARYLK